MPLLPSRLGTIITACVLTLAIAITSCTYVPLNGTSPATTTGQDLNRLAVLATEAYTAYKAGNLDYAWALSHALNAYTDIAKTAEDVKKLVMLWTGDATFADKLANIFGASNAPPKMKMRALANGVTTAAEKG